MVAELEKISITAKLSAYYRQYSDIAFASEVAALIGAESAFAELARDHGLDRDQLASYAPMFEARYKSVSELIRKSGASQILDRRQPLLVLVRIARATRAADIAARSPATDPPRVDHDAESCVTRRLG